MAEPERMKELAEIVMRLNGAKGTEPCVLMVHLCDNMIAYLREMNDNASVEDFKQNQGQIHAFKVMRGYILNGLPAPKTRPTKMSGGY